MEGFEKALQIRAEQAERIVLSYLPADGFLRLRRVAAVTAQLIEHHVLLAAEDGIKGLSGDPRRLADPADADGRVVVLPQEREQRIGDQLLGQQRGLVMPFVQKNTPFEDCRQFPLDNCQVLWYKDITKVDNCQGKRPDRAKFF